MDTKLLLYSGVFITFLRYAYKLRLNTHILQQCGRNRIRLWTTEATWLRPVACDEDLECIP
jgi:hypothetical protein